MKLQAEQRKERYYLKVGDLYVRDSNYTDISLTPVDDYAQEFLKGQMAFKETYLYATIFAKKHSLGKVTIVKVVRTIKEEIEDVDQLTLDNLNAFLEENKDEGIYRGL